MGSNTIKLLVATYKDGLKEIHKQIEESRISKGISQEKPVLLPESIERATQAVKTLIEAAQEHNVDSLTIVGTSAVRDARNGFEFANLLEEVTGYPLRILSGTEEAQFVAYGLRFDPNIQQYSSFHHFDLGGGSLEYNRVQDHELTYSTSIPLGAVRITEQFIPEPKLPIPESQIEQLSAHIEKLFAEHSIKPNTPNTLIFTGGSMTIARKIIQELLPGELINEHQISKNLLDSISRTLSLRSFEERLEVKSLPENRADVIPAALTLILTAARYFDQQIVVHSEYGLRHGLALHALNS